jgi:hypothetical protein
MANEKLTAEDVPMDDAVDMGLEEATPEPAPSQRMKYVGVPPYGTEFLTSHTITKDNVRSALERTGMAEDDVKEAVRGFKEVVWHRDRGWTADVSEMPAEMVEYLKNDPAWKTV